MTKLILPVFKNSPLKLALPGKRAAAFFAFVIFTGALFGCGLSRPYPEVRTFNLDFIPAGAAAAEADAPGPALKKQARVLLVTASPPPALYESNNLVYKISGQEYKEDFYNELSSPPARAVADSLARILDRLSSRFQALTTPGLASPDFVLETRILDFYGDFGQNPPVAVISLDLTLNDISRGKPRLVFSGKKTKLIPLSPLSGESQPESLVRALSSAVHEIGLELSTELAGSETGRKK